MNCVALCIYLTAGVGIHDTSFDSHFKEHQALGWFQVNVDFNENIGIYGRHESMPLIAERYLPDGGYGVNSVGIQARFNLYGR